MVTYGRERLFVLICLRLQFGQSATHIHTYTRRARMDTIFQYPVSLCVIACPLNERRKHKRKRDNSSFLCYTQFPIINGGGGITRDDAWKSKWHVVMCGWQHINIFQ